jgi:hypothetical protein
MPLYMRVPLPGPFVWSKRIGGTRRRGSSRFESPLYWLLGIWALEASVWLVIGLVCVVIWLVRVIAETRRQKRATAARQVGGS